MRAMLVFACAGLDSMIKHLIRDALPAVIDQTESVEKKFEGFVEKELGRDGTKLLTAVLTSESPRERLVEELVKNLTSPSLQSKDQVLRVASFFGLGEKDVFTNAKTIDRIFRVRNTITHEMDVDFEQPKRTRTPRRKQDMVPKRQGDTRMRSEIPTGRGRTAAAEGVAYPTTKQRAQRKTAHESLSGAEFRTRCVNRRSTDTQHEATETRSRISCHAGRHTKRGELHGAALESRIRETRAVLGVRSESGLELKRTGIPWGVSTTTDDAQQRNRHNDRSAPRMPGNRGHAATGRRRTTLHRRARSRPVTARRHDSKCSAGPSARCDCSP